MSLKNSLIVLWVYMMYGFGMWMFFSGYLLKRIVVHRNSTDVMNLGRLDCGDLESTLKRISRNIFSDATVNDDGSDDDVTLKRFDKAVVIIIDALRYDFASSESRGRRHHHHYTDDKMTVFRDVLDGDPDNGLLLKLVADPPTTTLQRLAGITTGSLPTFIDVSLNFASTAIQEDNLIHQLKALNKKVVFMGDETWETLFPGQFVRSYPFPSFDVKDLHTVDNGILSKIYDEIERDDWDVIIAHFLGVDHCGHRYGPNHPAMSEKLLQMDKMIRNVVDRIGNDTVLLVLGDHGMTQTGDHGGDSEDEVSTVLFMYSPAGIRSSQYVVDKEVSALQIDLVPTLAMLLGLPIPFSNLGSVIKSPLKLQRKNGEECNDVETDVLFGGALAAAENSFQVQRYLREYAKTSSEMSSLVLDEAETMFREASVLWKNMNSDPEEIEKVLRLVMKKYKEHLIFVQSECRRVWATFNLLKMVLGCVLLLLAVSSNFITAHTIFLGANSLKLLVSILFCICIVALYVYSSYIAIILAVLICYILRTYVRRYLQTILDKVCSIVSPEFVVMSFLILSSFSNSFVVLEDRLILFFIQSLLVYRFLPGLYTKVISKFTLQAEKMSKRTKHNSQRWLSGSDILQGAMFLALLFITRVSVMFHKCREEQPWCKKSMFQDLEDSQESDGTMSSSTSSGLFVQLCVLWSSVVIVVAAAVITANIIIPKKNYTAAMICIYYGFIFCMIFICLHYWLSLLPSVVLERILDGNEVVGARCVVAVSIIMFLVSWLFPLLPEKPWESQTNHIFSGSLCFFIFTFLFPLYLTAGERFVPSVTLMVASIVTFLSLDKLVSKNSGSSLNLNLVIWYLMTWHWFYGTGHQAVFPAIQWTAAFVLSKGVSSYILSGALVVLNTFSSQILYGLSLPLLLLWSEPPKDPSKPLIKILLKYISFFGVKLLATVFSCFVLRRHLMVWKVFTPKLIYEAIGMIVVMFSILVSYMFLVRVTSCFHRQIRKNINQLWYPKEQ